MASNFQQPGISNPEDKFNPRDNQNALLLFFPTAFTAGVKTEHGETDAITARVVRLNDGRVYDSAMIFSTALVTQLKGAIPDGMVLGTLGVGENKKGNPPWLLSPHTEDQVRVAEAWLAQNPRIQQAPAPQAPPTAAAWNAPTAPAAPQWGATSPAAPAAPQWGAPPAPAVSTPPSAPAPAAPTWGAPAEGVPGTAPAAWQNAGAPVPPPVAPPAPAGPPADPNLVAALAQKGVTVPPGTTHEAALGLWAIYGGQ